MYRTRSSRNRRRAGVVTRSMSLRLFTPSTHGANSTETRGRCAPASEETDNETIFAKIRTIESRFRSSCQQIVLLNQNLDDLQNRYQRAMEAEQRSFRYSLRLRMAVLEGIRNMYYEYACRKADELTNLRCRVFGPSEMAISDSNSEEASEIQEDDDDDDDDDEEDNDVGEDE